MPEPIHGVNTADAVAATSTAPAGTPDAGAAASLQVSDSSAVDVADVAQTEALLQSILQAASNLPDVDQAKVASLQQAIASGTYLVNPQSIAQKIVELEALLGTAGQVQ